MEDWANDKRLAPYQPIRDGPADPGTIIIDSATSQRVIDNTSRVQTFSQTEDIPRMISTRDEPVHPPQRVFPLNDETQAQQIIRLRLWSTFQAAHPTIQCFYHCAVYKIEEQGTPAHSLLPYYALGWILNVVDGIPSQIEPQEAQYHGSLTTFQDNFVKADFTLDATKTHRCTGDYVP